MEKIAIFSLCSCLTLVSGLVCWECEVVTSQEECLRRGKAVQCKPNQDQCQLTIRHGGWGDYPRIEKACKTLSACSENYIQNIQPAWASKGEQVQCNEEYPSSVCRCCCGTELCNQNRTSCLLSDVKRSCDNLSVPRHGSMSCNNQFNLRSVCNFKCKRSYALEGEKTLTCSNYGEWDYEQPRCRAVTCRPRLKTPEFGSMKCSNGINLRSKCRFQCEEDYGLSTPPVLQCIDDEDGDAYGVWSSPQPECTNMRRSCDNLSAPRHGSMSCNNQFNLRSVCNFNCKSSYALEGEKTLTCSNFGEWDYEQPRCRAITCSPRLKTPGIGSMDCSNGTNLGSICRFYCKEDYFPVNSPVQRCIDDEDGDAYGVWDSPQPECRRKGCNDVLYLPHGMISCTDGNYAGSVCNVTCDSSKGFELYQSVTRLTCLRDECWSDPIPCCSHTAYNCPQFAMLDLVIILDSSSSVGASNWVMMLNFIDTFVRQFTVRNDSTHFAAVRYNAAVDRRSQTTLNQYPDSTDDVARAIMRMPYDGSGTRTGRALQYVNDVLLPLGNRELATDVVLLLTDGASQDDVALPARLLRGQALVYVIPIQAPGRQMDLVPIRDIVGLHYEDRVFTDALKGGFEALNASLVDKITSRICDPSCYNPINRFHNVRNICF